MKLTSIPLLFSAFLLLSSYSFGAASCEVKVTGTTKLTYDLKEIKFPSACSQLKVTLYYEGKLNKSVMGHNLIISKTEDMDAIVKQAIGAGVKKDYIPPHKGVIASTKLLSGGESDTIVVKRSALKKGGSYMFFCTFPGHSALMRGTFIVE